MGLSLVATLLLVACGGGADDANDPDMGETGEMEEPAPDAMSGDNPIIALLEGGQPVFGIFSGDHTPEQGRLMAGNQETDFVFYSLEQPPFDIDGMRAYMAGLAEGAGDQEPHPVALRIPPVKDGYDQARMRTQQGLEAGVASVVFPHVVSGDDAQVTVEAVGDALWPANPNGSVVSMLIVEDHEGVSNVDAIMGTPGVSVVFAGPGDLSRAYEGDMEAVENAIQTVLASCLAHDVPCGITAGVDDIGTRLEQGFRVIIVTQPEALAVGLQASGRAG